MDKRLEKIIERKEQITLRTIKESVGDRLPKERIPDDEEEEGGGNFKPRERCHIYSILNYVNLSMLPADDFLFKKTTEKNCQFLSLQIK